MTLSTNTYDLTNESYPTKCNFYYTGLDHSELKLQ